MMTESRRLRELIIPITELRPGTWAVSHRMEVAVSRRGSSKVVRESGTTHRRRRSCATGYLTSSSAAQRILLGSRTLDFGGAVHQTSQPEAARRLREELAYLRVSSAIRWLLSIRSRSPSNESVTDAPLALLKALHTRPILSSRHASVTKFARRPDLISSRTEPSKLARCSASLRLV